jgi:hypothetical protein
LSVRQARIRAVAFGVGSVMISSNHFIGVEITTNIVECGMFFS